MSDAPEDAPTKVGPAPAPPPPPAPAPPEPPRETVGHAVWIGVKQAGAPVYNFLDMIGGHLILVARSLAWLPRRPARVQQYLDAAEYIGFGSLPIVLLVGAFTGM